MIIKHQKLIRFLLQAQLYTVRDQTNKNMEIFDIQSRNGKPIENVVKHYSKPSVFPIYLKHHAVH